MLNSTVMINSWGVVAAQRSTSFGCGKGGNVTSAGWQVTLCDPVWHVSSRSGVATLRTAIHLLLNYLGYLLTQTHRSTRQHLSAACAANYFRQQSV